MRPAGIASPWRDEVAAARLRERGLRTHTAEGEGDMTTDVPGASPGRHTGRRVAVGLLGGAALVVGVVLLFDPVAAARTLALLLGLSLVIGGLLEIAVGWDSRTRRGIAIALGAVLVIVGVLAVAWPKATVLVLSLVLGAQIAAFGALLLAYAFRPSGTRASGQPVF